jgi:SHS family lactate transporter-like MFS transporter
MADEKPYSAQTEYPSGAHTTTVSQPSAGRYAATRLSTLKPPMAKVQNPIALLRLLNLQQWLFFLVAFFAWTWDAFDFFTVSLTVENLAESFGKTKKDITWGITLVLMLRSVGSIIFGLAADRYGRKWPFIINNLLFIVLELGTGFCTTYEQFLGVRALFGIAMGGLYGNAAATGKLPFPPPQILARRKMPILTPTQPSKTAPKPPAASSPECCSKATLLATCSRPSLRAPLSTQ